VLDQTIDGPTIASHVVGPGSSGQVLAQVFRVDASGRLTYIDVKAHIGFPPATPILWEIYSTNLAGAPLPTISGASLASGYVSSGSFPTTVGTFHRLEIGSGALHVNAGERFSLVLSQDDPTITIGDPIVWEGTAAANYSGGRGYVKQGRATIPWGGTSVAYSIKTFIEPGPTLPRDETRLIASGDGWRYWDSGTNPGAQWNQLGFDASSWPVGVSELGYGDNDEDTTIRCGPSAPTCNANNFAAAFFRREFDLGVLGIGDLDRVQSLVASILRDDVAAVFLNGTQVFRDTGLPANAAFNSYAPGTQTTDNLVTDFTVDPSLLRPGVNVVAVQVHQAASDSSDLSFNFTLQAQLAPVPEPSTAMLVAAGCGVLACRHKPHIRLVRRAGRRCAARD
jgi:hypothetical protein